MSVDVKLDVVNVFVVLAAPCEVPFMKNSYVFAPDAVNVTEVPAHILLARFVLVKEVVGSGLTVKCNLEV